jgi:hypothetical protein
MKKLFASLAALLGQPDDGPEFNRLLQKIGAASRIYDLDEDNTIYEFYEFGFGVTYNRTNKKFWMLGFEFATEPVKKGAMKPFPDALYAGITSVESKLGVKPNSFRNSKTNSTCTGKYLVSPFQFTCVFDNPEGALTGMTIHAL